MLNQKSIDAVANSKFGDKFIKPLYDSYCFSNIPGTILSLFNINSDLKLPSDVLINHATKHKQVVVLLIDAFGWRFFSKYYDKFKFLKRFVEKGVASELTSQFPSTTAVHINTMFSGLPVWKHKVMEWQYYDPASDAIIFPFLYKKSSGEQVKLDQIGIEPKDYLPNQNFASILKNNDIQTYSYINCEYLKSEYNSYYSQETISSPIITTTQGLLDLKKEVFEKKTLGYFYMYLDFIDTINHNYGPDSDYLEEELITTLNLLERMLGEHLDKKDSDTVFILTADHGHTNTNPETTHYLNHIWPQISDYIKTNQVGDLLVPSGSGRDMFLYIKPGSVDLVKEKLSEMLKGKAEVHYTSKLLQDGFFGKADKSILERVGDLVILSYEGESVWWFEENKYKLKYLGAHGGLTPNEATIPFCIV